MVMSSGREHFILHWLLARAFPSSTMVVPWNGDGIGHTEDTCSKIKDVLKEKNQFKICCSCCRKELLPRLFHRHLAGSNCKAFIE